MLKQVFIYMFKQRISRNEVKPTSFRKGVTCDHSCSERIYASKTVEWDTNVNVGFLLGGPRILSLKFKASLIAEIAWASVVLIMNSGTEVYVCGDLLSGRTN